MKYFINRDVTMLLYAAVLFALVYPLHRLTAGIRRKRIASFPYIIGGISTAAWEFLYSAGDWWIHNNGLRGAYTMLAVPVAAVSAAAVCAVLFAELRSFSQK